MDESRGRPLFLPSFHSYVRTVASELGDGMEVPGKKSKLGMRLDTGYLCCIADK
jgi:hypothetical protein